MVKRFLVVAMALGLVASVASADVIFQWEPTTIEVGVPTEVTMSMILNPGHAPSGVSFIGVDFTPTDPELKLSDGAFLGGFGFFDPTTFAGYSSIAQLPQPFQASYGGVSGLVTIDSQTKTPTLKLTVTANAVGSYFLDTSGPGMPLYIEEGTFLTLPIKEGARQKIEVIPEPASLALLALGGLVAIRRR